MCELKTELKEANTSNKTIVKLKPGTRAKLVTQAKIAFKIEGALDVPQQTIHNRIKSGKLEVWHTGEISPVIVIKIILTGYVITAWSLNRPLSVADTIAMMNNLIEGTMYEEM